MLRDITGILSISGGNITANSGDIDTHSKDDSIWCMVINGTNTNLTLTDREGIVYGLCPRYAQSVIFIPRRDMAVQLQPINNGAAPNAAAPNRVWIGFDKNKLGDSYSMTF